MNTFELQDPNRRFHPPPRQPFLETAKTISSSLRPLAFPFPTSRCIKQTSRSAPSTLRRCHRCRSPSPRVRWPLGGPESKPRRAGSTVFGDECRREAVQPFAA